jgi:hypothetical protein
MGPAVRSATALASARDARRAAFCGKARSVNSGRTLTSTFGRTRSTRRCPGEHGARTPREQRRDVRHGHSGGRRGMIGASRGLEPSNCKGVIGLCDYSSGRPPVGGYGAFIPRAARTTQSRRAPSLTSRTSAQPRRTFARSTGVSSDPARPTPSASPASRNSASAECAP